MEKIYIVFYVLSVVSFGFAGYFFYSLKVKKFVINKSEGKKDSKGEVSIGLSSDGLMDIRGKKGIKIDGYKVSDIINTINNFIISFNKINKNIEITTYSRHYRPYFHWSFWESDGTL